MKGKKRGEMKKHVTKTEYYKVGVKQSSFSHFLLVDIITLR